MICKVCGRDVTGICSCGYCIDCIKRYGHDECFNIVVSKKKFVSHRYKKGDMIKGESHYAKGRCNNCGKVCMVKGLIYFKGKHLCASCRLARPEQREFDSIIGLMNPTRKFSLQEALQKTYVVKGYLHSVKGKDQMQCVISVPSVLASKKVKLILIK